ncbi:MAG TPA: cardiolipin synthase [Thermoleophilia bacterium]|nr:cardiolipin synthase [Thermoleophilia bacterium]
MNGAALALLSVAAPVAVEASAVAYWIVYGLIALALVGVVITLITDDRDPSTVLAWLFVLMVLPGIGLIAYFLIGRNFRRDSPRRRRLAGEVVGLVDRSLAPVRTANSAFTEAAVAGLAGTPGGRIQATGRSESRFRVLPADSVEVYTSGAQKFPALFADLAKAQTYIHLMYLIWEQDKLTAEVTEILLDRLAAGVQVHIIYDWLSCITYKKDELKRLAAAGAVVVPCYKSLRHLNYRNHMKMAIVDGEVVYTGGMNMGQEYIDGGERFAVWRDTHLRMTGAIVAPYIAAFAATWILNGRKDDLITGYVAEPVAHGPGDGIPVQMLHSSVLTKNKAIRDAFIVALTTARHRTWIQSPYFVPDEPLLTAMCVAASSGVDVRFMMTGVPDKKAPFHVAQAYYKQLIEAGVKVYQYKAGFLHAKTVTVDDQLCIIGTCNWDIRSIILHDEVVAALYDEGIATSYAEQYERDMAECVQITLEDLLDMSALQKFRNSFLRLFSRLM